MTEDRGVEDALEGRVLRSRRSRCRILWVDSGSGKGVSAFVKSIGALGDTKN